MLRAIAVRLRLILDILGLVAIAAAGAWLLAGASWPAVNLMPAIAIADVHLPARMAVGSLCARVGRGPVTEGWLLCDGRSVNRKDYPDLCHVINEAFGVTTSGDVRLPDYRGIFVASGDTVRSNAMIGVPNAGPTSYRELRGGPPLYGVADFNVVEIEWYIRANR